MNKQDIDEFFDGLIKNDKFLYWSRKAERGDLEAFYRLGRMYHDGYYVNQDFNKAFEWFHKAAKKGHDKSQFAIGEYYFIHDDYKNSIKWFKKSAKQGNQFASIHLGIIYENDLKCGVKQNFQMSYFWYKIALAIGKFGYWAATIDNTKKQLTKKQIIEADKKVEKYLLKNLPQYLK